VLSGDFGGAAVEVVEMVRGVMIKLLLEALARALRGETSVVGSRTVVMMVLLGRWRRRDTSARSIPVVG
jgi:hypothetical protein